MTRVARVGRGGSQREERRQAAEARSKTFKQGGGGAALQRKSEARSRMRDDNALRVSVSGAAGRGPGELRALTDLAAVVGVARGRAAGGRGGGAWGPEGACGGQSGPKPGSACELRCALRSRPGASSNIHSGKLWTPLCVGRRRRASPVRLRPRRNRARCDHREKSRARSSAASRKSGPAASGAGRASARGLSAHSGRLGNPPSPAAPRVRPRT